MTKIVLGDMKFKFKPMNTHEAIEAMFVLAPYVEKVAERNKILEKLSVLMDQIHETNPLDFFRLMAYMLHVDADTLIVEGIEGSEWYTAFATLLAENSAPTLIDVAYILGIAKSPWEKDYGIRAHTG